MALGDTLRIFNQQLREIHRLQNLANLADWDQKVCLPNRSAAERAKQLELLNTIIHEKETNPRFMDMVEDLWAQHSMLDPDNEVNVRETKRRVDRRKKIPATFVAEQSRASSICLTEWMAARPRDDFLAVRPHLGWLIELAHEESKLVGYKEHPYDALLDLYEPDLTISQLKPLLIKLADEIRQILPPLSAKLSSLSPFLSLAVEQQKILGRTVAAQLGFDFQSGRIDESAHPFCATLGPDDLRITTRYDGSNWRSSLYSTIHEVGHALYDLGLPREHYGTPRGSPISIGIHESQSRFWENIVGRSRTFCAFLLPRLRNFGNYCDDPNDLLWQDVNAIRPSLIRVEADEVSYSLHIVIRTLLEESLISGDLMVNDLPMAWNEMYRKYLGVTVPNDRDGVMQDIHWYHGAFGYFPSYALGNLYATTMWEKMRSDIKQLPGQFQVGDFRAALAWMRVNVHQHGMHYTGTELIKNISGKPLRIEPFVHYLLEKFAEYLHI